MLESENKIKTVIASIVGPFATAAAALLFILSLAEYFRHGFVSLFLDFRLLVVATLVLWLAAVLTEAKSPAKWAASITVGLALAASAPIIWRLVAPFGRLGLLTFVCGLAVLILIFMASIKSDRASNS